jgi:hypothetical protein
MPMNVDQYAKARAVVEEAINFPDYWSIEEKTVEKKS